MGFTEPDSPPPPLGVPQMPQASMPGIAPAPYTGPDQRPEPPTYAAAAVTWNLPGPDVMAFPGGTGANAVQESGYAHDVNAGLVSPFYAGAISPVQMPGPGDAGGRDDVAGTVAGAVANATGRYLEHEGDTHGIGSTIGDVMTFPPSPLDVPAGPGLTDPAGHYYDPPRNYGDEPA